MKNERTKFALKFALCLASFHAAVLFVPHVSFAENKCEHDHRISMYLDCSDDGHTFKIETHTDLDSDGSHKTSADIEVDDGNGGTKIDSSSTSGTSTTTSTTNERGQTTTTTTIEGGNALGSGTLSVSYSRDGTWGEVSGSTSGPLAPDITIEPAPGPVQFVEGSSCFSSATQVYINKITLVCFVYVCTECVYNNSCQSTTSMEHAEHSTH